MPYRKYYIDKDKTRMITLEWGFGWKNLTITEENHTVGVVENIKALREGRSFTMMDGSRISVRLEHKWIFIQELEILRNGKPLPGSGTDPNQQLKLAWYVLLFIGTFNMVLGIVAEAGNIAIMKSFGLGYTSLAVGAIYLLLGYLARFKLSGIAIYAAITLLVLDMVFATINAGQTEASPVSGLLLKIIFIMLLANGLQAIKKIKRERSEEI